MSTCPRCGYNYDGHPALSRHDNTTNICSDCGRDEALNQLFLAESLPNKGVNSAGVRKALAWAVHPTEGPMKWKYPPTE